MKKYVVQDVHNNCHYATFKTRREAEEYIVFMGYLTANVVEKEVDNK